MNDRPFVRLPVTPTGFIRTLVALFFLSFIPLNPITVDSSFTSLSTHVKATAGQRFLAYLIDALIAAIPVILFRMVSFNLILVGQLIALAYLFTRESLPMTGGYLGGQSVGKKLMNIKVIKEDTGAGIVGDYGTGIIRQVSLAIPLFNLVDALMVFTDDRKRFGDKWAKTIVVKA